MIRAAAWERLGDKSANWDVLVIGGGATGLGIAVDAASRGLRTALVERSDFAQGTSSRSTKLIHGGVRYLRQGNIYLVRESLRERGRLLRNAPALVHPLRFVVPVRSLGEKLFIGAGLTVYDLLSGSLRLGRTRWLSQRELASDLPGLNNAGWAGGVSYMDGQFDDAGLAVALYRTLLSLGGCALNYGAVVELAKLGGRIRGAVVRDQETGVTKEIRARVVINATGVFADELRCLDCAGEPPLIAPSQGTHIVLDSSFLPGNAALMIPKTDDGRVLFAIPWLNRVLIGTTDSPVDKISVEPRPTASEIDFLLAHAGRYLARAPRTSDIRSVFAGLRPLMAVSGKSNTSQLSREHALLVSNSGLITIAGGKWTTYRHMAEEAVDKAIAVAGFSCGPCRTSTLSLQPTPSPESQSPGPPHEQTSLEKNRPCAETMHPRLPYRRAEIIAAARDSAARTVADVLSRRTRALMLDAVAALEMAPETARILAKELGRDSVWEQEQVRAFTALARSYLP